MGQLSLLVGGFDIQLINMFSLKEVGKVVNKKLEGEAQHLSTSYSLCRSDNASFT